MNDEVIGAVVCLTWISALGLGVLYLSPVPVWIWLSGFLIWGVVRFRRYLRETSK